MPSLTCGERFIRCLIGEPIDRLPYGVGIGWCPWGETLDLWKRAAGDPHLDLGKRFGFDRSCAVPAVELGYWPNFAYQVLAEDVDYVVIWEDMSGRQGSLISPAMVEEFMMPCYDRIVDFARRHYVSVVSVDTDGNCRELVPLMMKHGVNVFFPFEVQAGNDILAYRRQYPTLGILGGLDKRALAAGTREVDAEIAKAAEMAKHGRYIPGFDHLIAPDAKWENYEYFALKMRDVCGL